MIAGIRCNECIWIIVVSGQNLPAFGILSILFGSVIMMPYHSRNISEFGAIDAVLKPLDGRLVSRRRIGGNGAQAVTDERHHRDVVAAAQDAAIIDTSHTFIEGAGTRPRVSRMPLVFSRAVGHPFGILEPGRVEHIHRTLLGVHVHTMTK